MILRKKLTNNKLDITFNMNYKYSLAALAILVSVSSVGIAHAQNSVVSVSGNAEVKINAIAAVNANANAHATSTATTSKVNATSTVRGNATSSAVKNEHASSTKGNATSTAAKEERASTTNGNAASSSSDQGKSMSEAHRSAVATFVHSLLAVADRDGGIGAQVRLIANSQNDSATTTAAAIAKVEGRGSMKTFFIGSDYKNLKLIRAAIATTTANIAQLKDLLVKATSDADRTELSAQIRVLEVQQAKLSAYVTAREKAFSLFGWMNK